MLSLLWLPLLANPSWQEPTDSPQALLAQWNALSTQSTMEALETRFQLAARLGLFEDAASALEALFQSDWIENSARRSVRQPVWESWRLWLAARPPALPSLAVFDGIGDWKLRYAAGYPEEAASLERLAQDMLLERRRLRRVAAANVRARTLFVGLALGLLVLGCSVWFWRQRDS